jgi:putative transposase
MSHEVPAGGFTVDTKLAVPVQKALLQRWEPLYRSQLHYLVTWSTRGRRPVLKDRHLDAIRALVQKTCEERGIELVEVIAGADRVHVLFGLKPAQSVASAVRELKGRTTMTLLQDFPELRVWLSGNLVWDERYAVETVSPLRVDRLRDRLVHTLRASREPFPSEGWAAAS